MSESKTMPAIALHGEAYLLQTRTKLDFSATESAFEQGRTAYATRDYSQAIEHYTRAVLALQSDLLSVIFLHRAAAYEMEKDYERSLEDCECANPTDDSPVPDAYFQRASALIFQNKLWEAFLTYVKGADTVPSTCPQRAELLKKRDQLMAVVENGPYHTASFENIRQLQQLTQEPKESSATAVIPNQGAAGILPSEVITHILSYMPIKSRVQLALTCRYWHKFIFCEWAEMWSTVDMTTNDVPTRSPGIQQFLRAVSRHQVRKLKLNLHGVTNVKSGSIFDDHHRFGNRSEAVFPAIQQLNWDKIGSLVVVEPSKIPFCRILGYAKNSLKTLELRITCSNAYRTEVLHDAVSNCRSLQSITSQVVGFRGKTQFEDLVPALPASNLYLTHLVLSCPMSHESIEHLFERSSHLEALRIDSRQFTGLHGLILHHIYKHCRVLQSLAYEPIDNQSLSTTYSRCDHDTSTPKGLKSLRLSIPYRKPTEMKGVDTMLCWMFERNHKTLESLDLELDSITPSKSRPIARLAKFGAPRLQVLKITQWNVDFDYRELYALLTASPSIEVAMLRGSSIWHDDILHALSHTPLRQLSMNIGNLDMIKEEHVMLSTRGIRALFAHARSLRSFSFTCNHDCKLPKTFIVAMAHAISAYSSINDLELNVPLSNAQLISVMSKLKKSQVLRKLALTLSCRIGIRGPKAIGSLTSLETLQITDLNGSITKYALAEILSSNNSKRLLTAKVKSKEGDICLEDFKAPSSECGHSLIA